jgi:hypothetical protein
MWVKESKISRSETLKLLKKIEKTLEDMDMGNCFLSRTSVVQEIDEWDCIKLTSFRTAKNTIMRIKRQPKEWEKIFASYSTDKELLSRIYKELKKPNRKRKNNSINKWANELNNWLKDSIISFLSVGGWLLDLYPYRDL